MARDKKGSKTLSTNGKESYVNGNEESRTTRTLLRSHSPEATSTSYTKLKYRVHGLRRKVNLLLIKDQKWKLKFKGLQLELQELKLLMKEMQQVQTHRELKQQIQVVPSTTQTIAPEQPSRENRTNQMESLQIAQNTSKPVQARCPPNVPKRKSQIKPAFTQPKGPKPELAVKEETPDVKPKPIKRDVRSIGGFLNPKSVPVPKKKLKDASSSSSESSSSESESESEASDSDDTVEVPPKKKPGIEKKSESPVTPKKDDQLFECPLSNACTELYTKADLEQHIKEKHGNRK